MMILAKVACAVGLVAFVGLRAGTASAGPQDTIKNFVFESQRVEYKDGGRVDPFEPLMPFRQVKKSKKLVVRIESLKLSSVMTGRRKIAILKELHGPTSYILVNNILLGSDRKPIPGIAGSITAINKYGEYRVTLQQGVDKIVFTMINKNLADMKAARERGARQ